MCERVNIIATASAEIDLYLTKFAHSMFWGAKSSSSVMGKIAELKPFQNVMAISNHLQMIA